MLIQELVLAQDLELERVLAVVQELGQVPVLVPALELVAVLE